MSIRLDLPIEAPSWFSVENQTDESAVMLDTNDELVPLKTLIEPNVIRWHSHLPSTPPIIITRVHAGRTILTGIVLSLYGEPPPGQVFVQSNGRVTRMELWKNRSICGDQPVAQRIFQWATHVAAWTWPEDVFGCRTRDFTDHRLHMTGFQGGPH